MESSEPIDDFDITKCSICLEEFNTPRCLPCLHTLCESCLSTNITSELEQTPTTAPKQFNCPVCRERVEPPEPTTPCQKWAGQFPLNNFVTELINQKKLISKTKLCDPCMAAGREVMAVIWCSDCIEALCETCLTTHARLKVTKNHSVKNVNELKPGPLITAVQACENHKDKNVEAFCKDHDQSCCTTCLAIHHRKCDHVVTLEDAARGVLVSSDFTDLLQRLSDISNLNLGLIAEKRENIQDLEKQKRDIEQELKEMRDRIVKHFDNLQSKFMRNFTLVHDYRVGELSYDIVEVENRNKVILNCTRVMTTCKTRGSETRVFLEMKRVLRKEKEQLAQLDKILVSHRRLEYLPKLDMDIKKMMTGFRSVGSVNVVENVSPIKIASFSINDTCVDSWFKGGCFLQDRTVLLPISDTKTLARITYTGELIKKSDVLAGCVHEVTTIDSNTAVVTRPDEKVIDFVNIETLTVSKTVSLNEPCYGITSSDNKLYVGCSYKLLVLDKDGNKVNELKSNSDYIPGITIVNGKEKTGVYTNFFHDSCHFVRLSDLKELYVFKHKDLMSPWGVTSDSEGDVYIAGCNSGSVLQVSSDGDLIRILFTGLDYPTGIQFDDNRLFVSYSRPASVGIYKMIKF